MQASNPKPGITPIAVTAVFFVVCLNLVGAWILKKATGFPLWSIGAAFAVGFVIAVNIGRFLIWGWMHRRIDLSKSYPLTAMFFPMITVLSVIDGEMIRPVQWFGIALITIGVVWFSVFVQDHNG